MRREKPFAAIWLGLALAGGMLCAKTSLAASIDAGFENGNLDTKLWLPSGNTPVVQNQITRSGKYAMKSVLNRVSSKTNYRTEVALKGGVHLAKWYQDTWYGFSIYLPSPYPADSIDEIVAQWHAQGGGAGGPPLSLRLKDGNWRIYSAWDERTTVTPESRNSKSYSISSAAVSKWTDWVFRIHWDWRKSGAGRLTVWQNGKQVLDQSGPIGYNQSVGPYFKMGIYKAQWQNRASAFGNERVLYHDAFRLADGAGAKYEDVAPSGSATSGTAKSAAPIAPKLVAIE